MRDNFVKMLVLVLLVTLLSLTMVACGSNDAANKDNGEDAVSTELMSAPVNGDVNKGDGTGDAENPPSVTKPPEQDDNPIQATSTSAQTGITQTVPSPALTPEANLPPVEPLAGYLAPDFTLVSMNGETYTLSNLRGQNAVLNFWVTWCIPCKDELPAIERISQDYQGENIVFLSINVLDQDDINKVKELVSAMGLTYPILLDENGLVNRDYRVEFFPTSFFIDENGIIQHVLFGSASEEGFRERIDKLINNEF